MRTCPSRFPWGVPLVGAVLLAGLAGPAPAQEPALNPTPTLVPGSQNFLGVAVVSTCHGEEVTQVVPDSPASRAGLEPGDVIVSVDDVRVGVVNGRVYSLAPVVRGARAPLKLMIRDVRTGNLVARTVDVSGGPPRDPNDPGPRPPTDLP